MHMKMLTSKLQKFAVDELFYFCFTYLLEEVDVWKLPTL